MTRTTHTLHQTTQIRVSYSIQRQSSQGLDLTRNPLALHSVQDLLSPQNCLGACAGLLGLAPLLLQAVKCQVLTDRTSAEVIAACEDEGPGPSLVQVHSSMPSSLPRDEHLWFILGIKLGDPSLQHTAREGREMRQEAAGVQADSVEMNLLLLLTLDPHRKDNSCP